MEKQIHKKKIKPMNRKEAIEVIKNCKEEFPFHGDYTSCSEMIRCDVCEFLIDRFEITEDK